MKRKRNNITTFVLASFFTLACPLSLLFGQSVQWTFGNSTTPENIQASVELPSGNILSLGFSEGNTIGGKDVILYKLSPTGNILWSREFGTLGDDTPNDMHYENGMLYVVGESSFRNPFNLDAFFLVIDTIGNQQLLRPFGGTSTLEQYNRMAKVNGGFAVAGYVSDGNGSNDSNLSMLDMSGNVIWERQTRILGNQVGVGVGVSPDGRYVYICGDRAQPDFRYNAFVAKYTSAGSLVWDTDVMSNLNGGTKDMVVSQNDDAILVGEAAPPGQYFDPYIIRVNNLGTIIWQNLLSGSSSTDAIMAVEEVALGNFVGVGFGGNTSGGRDAFMLAFNQLGIETDRSLYDVSGANEMLMHVTRLRNGEFLLSGHYQAGFDEQNLLITTQVDLVFTETATNSDGLSISPNPATSNGLVRFSYEVDGHIGVFNALGQNIHNAVLKGNEMRLPELADGLYYFVMEGLGSIKLMLIN